MMVNILGREYSIYTRPRAEDVKLKECDGYCDYSVGEIVTVQRAEDVKLKECDGYCDYSVGEIVTVQREDDPMNMRDQGVIEKRIMRHEIIHAFALESGLADDSAWAMNEEMTDWIAHQFPKMLTAFKAVGAL